MTHAIIIRFHYNEDDPRFEWRFAYFKACVLPRLLNQTVDSFDICIRCNSWHIQRFRDLSPRIKTFQVDSEFVAYKFCKNGKRYFSDFIPWRYVKDLPKYDIQTSLDSDDLVREDFIERIEEEVKKANGKSLHIYFQPEMFNLKTLHISAFPEYTDDGASAFCSIYQPNKENYIFINGYSHLHIGKHMEKSVKIPRGYCYATVHYHNESTGK